MEALVPSDSNRFNSLPRDSQGIFSLAIFDGFLLKLLKLGKILIVAFDLEEITMENHVCLSCNHKMCAGKVPIFNNLDAEQLTDVIQLIIRRKYKKGEMVFLQGDQLEGLYIINHGKIKIFRYTKEGKEQILYILSEGDFFGELSLLNTEEVNYYAEALEPVNLCLIKKSDFAEVLRENPKITIKVLEAISQRLSKLEILVQSLGTKEVEARIAQMLLELVDEFGIENSSYTELTIPLTREDMANYIGVTRETISRKLSNFQEEGILKLVGNKKIRILCPDGLKDYI